MNTHPKEGYPFAPWDYLLRNTLIKRAVTTKMNKILCQMPTSHRTPIVGQRPRMA